MSRRFPLHVLTIFFVCCFAAACSNSASEKKPTQISGKVSLDGKPLDDGEIYFSIPGFPPETLKITNGRFEGNVQPGEKDVKIFAYSKPEAAKPVQDNQPPAPAVRKNYLPARYNEQSTLKATVSESGVEPSTFELKSD